MKELGNIDFRPTSFCDGPRLHAEGRPGPDVYVITTGTMDDEGYFNHGLSCGNEHSSIRRYGSEPNTLVVIEANAQMPHVLGIEQFGANRFHISQVDRVIELDEPVREFPSQEPTEADLRIAESVAELVEDGATVQFGIGALPDHVAELLKTKKDLGVHSEMISETPNGKK